MPIDHAILRMPPGIDGRVLSSALTTLGDVAEIRSAEARLCYLDSFDWRMHAEGWVLEAIQDDSGVQLLWRDMGGSSIRSSALLERLPRFGADLPPGSAWNRLRAVLEMRALLPLAARPVHLDHFVLRDGEGKQRLRGSRWQSTEADSGVPVQIRLEAIRGYEKNFRQALKVLKGQLGCHAFTRDPALHAFAAAHLQPGDYVARPVSDFPPVLRTDAACRQILWHLLMVMNRNEVGIRKQIDSEFLHDFRVAVRRSRSLITQVKGIFPRPRERRFRRELAWLGRITGPLRDLDVYLLDFERFRTVVPAGARAGLEDLHAYLQRRHEMALRRLLADMRLPRYRRLMSDWKSFLQSPLPRRSSLPNASRPVKTVADERIHRLYRRAVKEGRAIHGETPAEALHELRKTCKKLRYLMEFFRHLYPAKRIGALIKVLKCLQDNLGEYQDLQVQQESLTRFERDMEWEGILSAETRNAIDCLVRHLAGRERLVRREFSERFRGFAAPAVRAEVDDLFPRSL